MIAEIKQRIIGGIIEREGGYADHPHDSGGPTNFGITQAVAIAEGYGSDVRALTYRAAFSIYAARYWDSVSADELAGRSEALAEEVVDTAVNCGVARAARFLQTALHVLADDDHLVVDGRIGPQTLRYLDAYLSKRDIKALLLAANCLQGAFYIDLALRRPKDRAFIYGWLMNRILL